MPDNVGCIAPMCRFAPVWSYRLQLHSHPWLGEGVRVVGVCSAHAAEVGRYGTVLESPRRLEGD